MYTTEYAKLAAEPITESNFTDADSLVFSQLSYIRFEGLAQDGFKPLREIASPENIPMLCSATRVPTLNAELISAAAAGRFNALVGRHINNVDHEKEMQFSATTFLLNDNLLYVAFRGTDSGFIGWKEDLNMAYIPVVPSQYAAVEYLNSVPDGRRIIVGGHSKGGNLAEYAAAYCNKEVKNRIVAVYDHDGPGFRPGTMDAAQFAEIAERVHKTVPESSIIGMLLDQPGTFEVIKSTAFVHMQHDPFSWVIAGNRLERGERTEFSRKTQIAIREWTHETGEYTQRVVTRALFELLESSKADTFGELKADVRENAPAVLNAIKNEPPEVKAAVTETLHRLLGALRIEIKISTAERMRKIKQEAVTFRNEKIRRKN